MFSHHYLFSATRAWYRVDRKQTVIKTHELPVWFKAVVEVKDERSTGKSSILRDYFLLLLFTGLRRQEAIELTWDRVDFKAKTITITDTKNHHTHILPLSDFLLRMFENRKAESESDVPFVFPGSSEWFITSSCSLYLLQMLNDFRFGRQLKFILNF